ncbi:hypothetical protein Mapa_016414 [Marchantia paleacea]|nr:hypothetical protein Mapa_016414 [Marchantia paleacea]
MSNTAKNAEYSSDDEEEESDSEEGEQPKILKGKVDIKIQERNQQEEEESSEEEDDSETDTDAHRYHTVRREGNPAVAAKTAILNNPVGKRGREGEGKDEEPASKKSKEVKVERVRAPAKPASPTRATKGEPGCKVSKAAASAAAAAKGKQEKAKKLEESTKASAAGRKRKAPSPPANGAAKQQSQKLEVGDKGSPQKTKTPFTWTNNLEIALCSILYHGKGKGKPVPGTKGDPYWTKLVKDLSSEGGSLTETQLSEKVRRMKNRYNTLKAKDVDSPWRNPHEEKLYRFWDGIWGSGKYIVRPSSSQGVPDDGDEEEESSEEEEEVATPAVKASTALAPASRKEESSESEEDSDDEEEPQVALKKDVTSLAGPSNEAELSAFVPKPRLEYTPLLPKDEKKVRRGDDGSIAEQSGAELSADENDREGLPPTSVMSDLMRSLRKESFALLQEVRAGCMDAVNVLRKQGLDDLRGGNFRLGANGPASGMWKMDGSSLISLDRGILDDLTAWSVANAPDSAAAGELKSDWRQLRVEEMDLLEKRIQLALKQLQHARKEFEEQDNLER